MENQKRKEMFRRFMAVLLCVAVLFSVLPQPVLAGQSKGAAGAAGV
ncbi:MAG: hypothetical protein K6F35_02350 [Lachnospiraceae bacterium]|nr:hypothetical protein [Lachnospiraceae bacterium]